MVVQLLEAARMQNRDPVEARGRRADAEKHLQDAEQWPAPAPALVLEYPPEH